MMLAMTELLKKVLARIQRLPPERQDELATWLMQEIEDNDQWETSFAASEDMLEAMANEALKEHAEGKTKPLDMTALGDDE